MKVREKEVTYKIMSSIKSANTRPELALSKELFRHGLRYRKQYKIKGKPDIVFVKKKIALFVDGDFWHGNNWKIRGMKSLSEELDRYSEFWKEKILRNIERDKEVNTELEKDGWLVLRYWESDIKINLESITREILKYYQNR
jgi:DNA mismatch endonuclease (patch repair protein)